MTATARTRRPGVFKEETRSPCAASLRPTRTSLRDSATATSISYCVSGMLVDTQSAIFFAYVSAIQPGVR